MRKQIRDGIAWPKDEDVLGAECARCGGDVEWLDCWNCHGRGVSGHECGEDCCNCVHPEENVPCDWCQGSCGAWHCSNPPAFCEANPIPGREQVESTALRHEVWDDG